MLWKYLSENIPENTKDLELILLRNRSISNSEEFFKPKHPTKFSLSELEIDTEQMQKSVARILRAKKNNEKVLIFGDYDADGICATAILWHALKSVDIISVPFIPRRDVHGYGITKKALDEIIEVAKPTLIITVDNGIVAHAPIEYAQEHGIDVILTDHHQPDTDGNGEVVYPQSYSRIHTTKLCGSTVSWMLAHAISPDTALLQLDLAGLATIADQVPLQGANRSFATHGLEALRKTKRVGLKALGELGSVDFATLTAGSVGFGLAPRINAMGRLAHGLDALRLLCTNNWQSARKLARTLTDTNVDRQDLTMDQLQIAIQQVEIQQSQSVLFAASEQFHEGVIGLIAGRLVELYHKPALVMSIGEVSAKGSARSVAGVNIVELLREVRQDLLEVGGHPMAAGFGASLEKVEIVKNKLFTLAHQTIDQTLLIPQIVVDCKLPFALATEESIEKIEQFNPFGSGNPEPIFSFENLRVLGSQTIGKESQHLKLLLCDKENENKRCEAMFWRQGELTETVKIGDLVSVVARLEINEWKGKKKTQLVVKDIIPSDN